MALKKIRIVIDFGASRLKAFWSCWVDGTRVSGHKLLMSAVDEVTPSSYIAKQSLSDATSYVQFDGRYWCVGEGARSSCDSVSVTGEKSRQALIKALAIVGQIHAELPPSDEYLFDVALLLPKGEMDDADDLVMNLSAALHDFGFNGESLDLRSGTCRVFPEGHGMAMHIGKYPGCVLMLGYRDASLLPVSGPGQIADHDSVTFGGYGMVRLLRKTNYVFKDELRAAAAIYAAGDGLDEHHLAKVSKPNDEMSLKAELEESRPVVWRSLVEKLQDTVSFRSAEQVLCTGGTAYYLRTYLKDLLGSRYSVGAPILKTLKEEYPDLAKNGLIYRCADPFALLLGLEKEGSVNG